jgi:hypothetical protein
MQHRVCDSNEKSDLTIMRKQSAIATTVTALSPALTPRLLVSDENQYGLIIEDYYRNNEINYYLLHNRLHLMESSNS